MPPGTCTAIVTALDHQPAARSAVVQEGSSTALGVVSLERTGGERLPAPGSWRIDPVHSSVLATTQHLGISSIHGRLKEFGGRITVADPLGPPRWR